MSTEQKTELEILRGGLEDLSEALDDKYIRHQVEHIKEMADKILKEADKAKDGPMDLDKIKPARTERLGHGYGG